MAKNVADVQVMARAQVVGSGWFHPLPGKPGVWVTMRGGRVFLTKRPSLGKIVIPTEGEGETG